MLQHLDALGDRCLVLPHKLTKGSQVSMLSARGCAYSCFSAAAAAAAVFIYIFDALVVAALARL